MRLLVLSDVHLEVENFELSDALDFDVAILAGDIGEPGELAVRWIQASPVLRDKDVLWVPGNHEYYRTHMPTMREKFRSLVRGSHVHLLDTDAIFLGDVRFLGATLWTDFSLAIEVQGGIVSDPWRAMSAAAFGVADYRLIRVTSAASTGELVQSERPLRPQDTARLHAAQRAWLAAQLALPIAGQTVVVTHHAPHRGSLAPKFAGAWTSAAFVNELPEEFFRVPVLWVHGHTHECHDYVVQNTRVVCNPRGYGTEEMPPGFRPHLIIEV